MWTDATARRRLACSSLAAAMLACAHRAPASPPPPPQLSAAEAERCTAISDSVFALPYAQLPPVVAAEFKVPRPLPAAARQGGGYVFAVRVFEGGTPDFSSLRIVKPDALPEDYLAKLRQALERGTYQPVLVRGCRVPARFDVVVNDIPG